MAEGPTHPQIKTPFHIRLWRAIKPPPAVPSERQPLTPQQRRLIQFAITLVVLIGGGWSVYAYIASAPDRAERTYQRGMILLGPGDFRGAIVQFSRAVDTWSGHAQAYLQRGNAHRALSENLDALADFNKALETNPKLATAYTARGRLLQSQGKLADALKDYDRSVELEPSVDGYFQRGQVYQSQHDLEHALADYTSAIELLPDAPYVYFARSIVKRDLGDEAGSEQDQAEGEKRLVKP